MTNLVEAQQMSLGYNGHPVVREIDLHVQAGEVVALLGPNGAGKTTTLMGLAGRIRPLGGSLFVDGKLCKDPLHRRAVKGMSLVTEEKSVFMRLSTLENLRVGRCDIDRALEAFPELKPLLSRTAGQLSGGEQQILTLARALARGPRVLLADELSLGLAPKVVVRLLDAVRRAADGGLGVVLVEQHIHQALRVADRAYVLNHGSIVLSGTSEEIRPNLESAYLTGSGNDTEAVAEEKDGVEAPVERSSANGVLHTS